MSQPAVAVVAPVASVALPESQAPQAPQGNSTTIKDKLSNDYVGSPDELKDLRTFCLQYEGDMDSIVEHMLFSSDLDRLRFRTLLLEEMKAGRLKEMPLVNVEIREDVTRYDDLAEHEEEDETLKKPEGKDKALKRRRQVALPSRPENKNLDGLKARESERVAKEVDGMIQKIKRQKNNEYYDDISEEQFQEARRRVEEERKAAAAVAAGASVNASKENASDDQAPKKKKSQKATATSGDTKPKKDKGKGKGKGKGKKAKTAIVEGLPNADVGSENANPALPVPAPAAAPVVTVKA